MDIIITTEELLLPVEHNLISYFINELVRENFNMIIVMEEDGLVNRA